VTGGVRPVTLVTGAASGIGRATVELLLETGGAVVALDRDPDALGWLAGNGRARAVIGHVTSQTDKRGPARST
jgi:NADP-dependent 3-hydroxy acid dehydrogenase YdfG